MSFFDFLITHSKVETIIGLLAFIVAGTLGYFAYANRIKYNQVKDIITAANTQSKVELTRSILNVLPSYNIPDLNKKDGFEIVKIQLGQREKEYESKIRLLRLCVIILAILITLLIIKNGFQFSNNKEDNVNSTFGDGSPIMIGDRPNYNTTLNSKDTVK